MTNPLRLLIPALLLGTAVLLPGCAVGTDPARGTSATVTGPAPAIDGPLDLTGGWWIWYKRPDASGGVPADMRFFRRTFDVPDGVLESGATFELQFVADNIGTAYLNGVQVGASDDWQAGARYDVTAYVRPGTNVLAFSVLNEGDQPNPGGLNARLASSDGTVDIQTNSAWRAGKDAAAGWTQVEYDDSGWRMAREIAMTNEDPWGVIGNSRTLMNPTFPQYIIPGFEDDAEALQHLFAHHYGPIRWVPFYSTWIVKSITWPDVAANGRGDMVRDVALNVLESRIIDETGYVSTLQHHGLAHPNGWPFPLWTQGLGWGWHFTLAGSAFGEPFGINASPNVEGYTLHGVRVQDFDDVAGAVLVIESEDAYIDTPEFEIDSYISPYFRFEWDGEGWAGADPVLQWREVGDDDFTDAQSQPFKFDEEIDRYGRRNTLVDLQDLARAKRPLAQFRINFGVPADELPKTIKIHSMYTAVDSRHNINNSNYVREWVEYLRWTGDIHSLRAHVDQIRNSIRYAIDEFNVDEYDVIKSDWVGHNGNSGIGYDEAGNRVIRYGEGIGDNYWDLMPFGGQDALATMYFIDAADLLAELEDVIGGHPEWDIPATAGALSSDQLRGYAERARAAARERFFNPETGRFTVGIAEDGTSADYGYTFLNQEAIYYRMASDAQAREIMDWIAGDRIVEGDTSTGADIYKFVFAPRTSTKRNVDYYQYVWPFAASIPFGFQIQDGGAGLGFTYYDLMARLRLRGADDAWERLREIAAWYRDVRDAGGYRAYYEGRTDASLQGGGTPGGLGLDFEFIESVLATQVMLYGFMGVQPRLDAMIVAPELPSAFTEFTITGVRYHDVAVDITASRDRATVTATAVYGDPAKVQAGGGWELAPGADGVLENVGDSVELMKQ